MVATGLRPLIGVAISQYKGWKSPARKGCVQMALVEQLPVEAYLKGRGVPYDIEFHMPAASALAEAHNLNVMPTDVLKAVLLRVDDGFAVAIIPASRRLHMGRVRAAVGGRYVRLATEEEIQAEFPEYQLGALPPVPGVLGIPGFVEPIVLEHEVVAFADGVRTESIFTKPRRLFWGQDIRVAPLTWDPFIDLYIEGDAVDVRDN